MLVDSLVRSAFGSSFSPIRLLFGSKLPEREVSLNGIELTGEEVLSVLKDLKSQPDDLENPAFSRENTDPADWVRHKNMLVSQGESRQIGFRTKGMVLNTWQELTYDSWVERARCSVPVREKFYHCTDTFRGCKVDSEIKLGGEIYKLDTDSFLRDEKGKFAGTWSVLHDFSKETLEWSMKGLLIALYK